MRRKPSLDQRLRSALWFSAFSTAAVLAGSVFMRMPGKDDVAGGMLAFSVAGALVLASLLSVWSLLACLLDRRPAWRDRLGLGAWLWTLAVCVTLGGLGWAGHASAGIGSTILYGAGLFAVGSGAIGLTIAALPPRRSEASRG